MRIRAALHDNLLGAAALVRVGISCAALGLQAVALAQSPAARRPAAATDPSVEDKETARSLYRLGCDRFEAGDYHGALEAFSAADRIMGVPTTGFELARTQAKLGLLLEARDRALGVTRYPARPDEPEPYQRARQEASALAVELERRIPSIRVELLGPAGPVTDRDDAEMALDGKALTAGQRMVPRRLNPGPHAVEVTAIGFDTFRGTVSLAEGEQRVLQVTLTPTNAERAAAAGEGPEDAGDAAVGAYVSFAVGGAALVVGAITGGLTLSSASDLKDACPGDRCPEQERDALSNARTLGHVSTGCFIAGAVGLGVGVGLLVWSLSDDGDSTDGGTSASLPKGPRTKTPRPEVRAWLGPSFVGLGGRF